MNIANLDDYTDLLETILSVGYELKYSSNVIEHAIANSSYFQLIEKEADAFSPLIEESALIESCYPKLKNDSYTGRRYVECYWVAEVILRIQLATKLTFECIFLYFPLAEIYEYFPLYHEMDFSQILKVFEERYQKQSALAILLDNYEYQIQDVAEQVFLSSEMVKSLKNRRREIQKTNVAAIVKLANFFHVRIETIAELKMN